MNHILTSYDWVYGIAQIAAVILSIIAGLIAVQLFTAAQRKKSLLAWKTLSIVLILFAIEEVLGTLSVFGIYRHPFLTHIIPTFMLGLLIAALVTQINLNRGCNQ
ncbi:hypothetical protein HY484_01050 [Candidatus Woesearchaeota archaeon]|nr:hypothetical protein [Candidatus Woesearchaeota archaeon]